MASSEEIVSIARKVWPQAANIKLTPNSAGHTSFTGNDPSGFKLLVSDRDGGVIKQLAATTLDDLKSKVTQLLPSEGKK